MEKHFPSTVLIEATIENYTGNKESAGQPWFQAEKVSK
jgi:hypothetical protein